MSITKQLEQVIQFISDAATEIFSPNHDDYPLIGIQPFSGEMAKRKNRASSNW